MRRGAVVEMGATERVFGNPLHPYTQSAARLGAAAAHEVGGHARGGRRVPDAVAAARSSRSRTTTSSSVGERARMTSSLLGAVPAAPAAIPWEERPAGSSDVVWRSSRNPVIPRDLIPRANSIFNSAVVPYGDGFAGVFRVDDTRRTMNLHAGFSDDGVDWQIDPEPIAWAAGRRARARDRRRRFEHAYDPRVDWLEDRYYVTWCNGYHGPTIGVGWTHDFETFHQLENAFLPFNRNGVLFPRQIGGKYLMLSRPSDNGHTPFGDIFYSESPDLVHWGRHRHVMAPEPWRGSRRRSAPGPMPIETDDGWLMIYHGVLTSCNGFVYSMGAALLDLDEPWRVDRTRPRLPALAAGAVRAGRRRAERRLPVRRARRPAGRPLGDLLRRRRHGHVPGARAPVASCSRSSAAEAEPAPRPRPGAAPACR